MDDTTDVESWCEYWEQAYDSGARLQLERAAKSPEDGWLVVDVPVVVDEPVEGDLTALHRRPEEVFSAARDGFRAFATESNIEDVATAGFDSIVIHPVGLSQFNRNDRFTLKDMSTAVGTLSVVRKAAVVSAPTCRLQPRQTTYRCPAGHTTELTHTLYRTRTLEQCGEQTCSNDVHIDDTQTSVRSLCEFSVDWYDQELQCVAVGRYGDGEREQFFQATQVHLTGILRFLTDASGDVTPCYYVCYAAPA